MFPVICAAVWAIRASQTVWSTHDFWLRKVQMVALGTISSPSFPINPTSPDHDVGCVSMDSLVAGEGIVQLRQSGVHVCLWWNVDHTEDNWCELLGKMERVTFDGQELQVGGTGAHERHDIPAVTPVVVYHETYSPSPWFSRVHCSVHAVDQKGLHWLNGVVWYWGGQPGFHEAEDVAVPYVSLVLYPGPEVVQLVL